ncbi:hypothetical protein KIK06_11490 [Nocardiopsis sp. EMB25]|uniref:hypothetical protein n=1 Tax=Nocardiopsis sp. EMB25 TaxID=2835867 RepID=UPI0022833670|nr:hypothetical protein [Nocardiopsis sp. EMB25]MCY9784515.1 hypothetical protein [Nocardiopsis sp. EMB25]
MTVTVIIIIAIIVVLAVLVLLLLGMRALSTGSSEDARGDDHEYEDREDAEAEDRGRGRGGEAPRRSRRARTDGDGGSGRRPRSGRRRGVAWDDDSDLADNGFWSSLDGEGRDERLDDETPDPRAAKAEAYDDVDAYGDGYDDGYEDGYDDYDEGYEDERGPAPEPVRGAGGSGADAAAHPSDVTAGPTDDLAVLASLGQSAGPVPAEPRESEPRPRAESAGPEAPRDDDPLGTGPWTPSRGLPSAAAPEPWSGATDRDPRGGAGSVPPGSFGGHGTGDPLSSPYPGTASPGTPSHGTPGSSYTGSHYSGSSFAAPSASGEASNGAPAQGDPLSGPSGYGSGAPTFGDPLGSPRSDRAGSSDPLDPGFRPSPSGEDAGSPIWSSMDTGAHQRPAARHPLGYGQQDGPGASGGHDTGTHRRPAHDTGAHAHGNHGAPPRPEYDTGAHSAPAPYRPEYDTGSHAHGNYGTPPFPQYDTGAHSAPAPYRPEYDTGSHRHRSHDTGSHARGSYSGDALWGGTDAGLGGPSAPTGPGSGYASGGFGGDHTAPTPPGHAPFDTGGDSRFPVDPPAPGGAFPGGPQGFPSGGYPVGPYSGDHPAPSRPPADHGARPPRFPEPYGGVPSTSDALHPDMLDGHPQQPGHGNGYPPADEWQRWENGRNGTPPPPGHPNGALPGTPYGPPPSSPDTLDPRGTRDPYGREYYEGGYEDGRFL